MILTIKMHHVRGCALKKWCTYASVYGVSCHHYYEQWLGVPSLTFCSPVWHISAPIHFGHTFDTHFGPGSTHLSHQFDTFWPQFEMLHISAHFDTLWPRLDTFWPWFDIFVSWFDTFRSPVRKICSTHFSLRSSRLALKFDTFLPLVWHISTHQHRHRHPTPLPPPCHVVA